MSLQYFQVLSSFYSCMEAACISKLARQMTEWKNQMKNILLLVEASLFVKVQRVHLETMERNTTENY